MKIYVPSTRRAGATGAYCTLRNLPVEATLVVYTEEVKDYQRIYSSRVVGTRAKGIAAKRQFILELHAAENPQDPRLCMMDDDLRFYKRRTDDVGKFVNATGDDCIRMIGAIHRELRDYAVVGVSSREGGNNQTVDECNTRMTRVLGYNVDMLYEAKVEFGRIQFMEDFDVQLQLARKGYASRMLSAWAQGQKGSGEAGGCSTYRTMELHAKAAHELHRLHPEFVKVREVLTKTSFGGGTRTDVTVYWKRAYASSQ